MSVEAAPDPCGVSFPILVGPLAGVHRLCGKGTHSSGFSEPPFLQEERLVCDSVTQGKALTRPVPFPTEMRKLGSSIPSGPQNFQTPTQKWLALSFFIFIFLKEAVRLCSLHAPEWMQSGRARPPHLDLSALAVRTRLGLGSVPSLASFHVTTGISGVPWTCQARISGSGE